MTVLSSPLFIDGLKRLRMAWILLKAISSEVYQLSGLWNRTELMSRILDEDSSVTAQRANQGK